MVIGIQRRRQLVRERLRRINFRVGDILLMTLPKDDLGNLRRDNDFVLLSVADAKPDGNWRSWFALGVMAAVVGARCLSA